MIIKSPQERWPNLFDHNMDAITGNLWGMNPGGGRFYAPGRRWISTLEKLDLLKAAGILWVEAHDTDILDLVGCKAGYPPDATEKEKMELLDKAVTKFITELDARSMKCGMFTMNMFNSDPMFNFGNFSSENVRTRKLAVWRTKMGLSIAQKLRCVYVAWNGTDGVDGIFGANHSLRTQICFESIVEVLKWHHEQYGFAAVPFAFEPKCEEPKYKMYNGFAAHVVAIQQRLLVEHPEFAHLFGGNLEIAHSVMGKADPAMDWGFLLAHNALLHTHCNGQGDVAYDRDIAPSPFELFDCMYQLERGGYKGLLGIDVQPLPTDRDDQAAATIDRTARLIRWAVQKARTVDHDRVASLRANHDQAGLESYVLQHLLGI